MWCIQYFIGNLIQCSKILTKKTIFHLFCKQCPEKSRIYLEDNSAKLNKDFWVQPTFDCPPSPPVFNDQSLYRFQRVNMQSVHAVKYRYMYNRNFDIMIQRTVTSIIGLYCRSRNLSQVEFELICPFQIAHCFLFQPIPWVSSSLSLVK